MSVFICNDKAEEAKKSFSSDWAENFAESDKGSFFDQEQWLKEFNEKPLQHLVQADQKLRLKNLLQIWKAKTLKHGKSSMATLLQSVKECKKKEKINKSVTCCFCEESLQSKNGLGSTWMF